jgi:hypothetical protein
LTHPSPTGERSWKASNVAPDGGCLRACGRNPLVRDSDRLELLIVSLGILVVLIAAACAGALGTAVHDACSSVYTTQAHTRQTLVARAIDDSSIVLGSDEYTTKTRVNARWRANGTEHSGSLTVDKVVKIVEPLKIWVDLNREPVEAPTPISRAGVDAVGVAYGAWQLVALAAAGLFWWDARALNAGAILPENAKSDASPTTTAGGNRRSAPTALLLRCTRPDIGAARTS